MPKEAVPPAESARSAGKEGHAAVLGEGEAGATGSVAEAGSLLDQVLAAREGVAEEPGLWIGKLEALEGDGFARVALDGAAAGEVLRAAIASPLTDDDLGRRVVVVRPEGANVPPLVLGVIRSPEPSEEPASIAAADGAVAEAAEVDGERLVLNAEREIVLRCGKSSLTLTKAGKIVLRGEYVLSRATGVHRIKGGAVQIN